MAALRGQKIEMVPLSEATKELHTVSDEDYAVAEALSG
jgi:hypothetical protein